MSIGQALAEARQQAGLTVADISQRTRIREGIICGIEAEDFSVCGGDFYARGHIRSIARVVGTDPVPLVAEYDQVWRDRGGSTDVRHVMDLITGSRTAPPVEAEVEPPAEAEPPVEAEAEPLAEADTGTLGDSARWGTSGPPPWRTAGPGRRAPGWTPPRRRLNWTAVLAVAVIMAFGLIGYELMSGGGQPPPAAAPAASRGAANRHPAEHGSGTPVPQRTRQTSAPAVPSPTPTPPGATAAAPPVASKSMTPASATAFGPGGAGQGDNAGLAHLAVDSSPGSAWHTDWYTSANFGNLYSGTGLLVDLGQMATITGARISLGSAPGAAFELRAGPSPSALRTVARADGVSGLVSLRLSSPVQGRYLLIWFTRLPDDAGTFEASVHDVKVTVRS